MTTLVRSTAHEVNPAEVQRIVKSKLAPEDLANDAASAEVIMRIGASLGLDPMGAFQHIYVFPDKKTGRLRAGLSAHLMHALAIAAGHALHVEGDAVKATAVLVRHASSEDLTRFQVMREQERRQKNVLLEDMDRLYGMERRQILDRLEDLKALAELGGQVENSELLGLRKQLTSLAEQYDFDNLRKQVLETKFDLAKLLRFECTWTMGRARSIEGLTNKSTWQNYGPEMLKSRCKSTVVRDGAIEVILGVRSIMRGLGLEFSDSVDDRLAVGSLLYTPEEQEADVDEEGAPLVGRVVDVTAPGVNKEQDRLRKVAETMVGSLDAEGIVRAVDAALAHEKLSSEEKAARILAFSDAVREHGKTEEVVPCGEESGTLGSYIADTLKKLT